MNKLQTRQTALEKHYAMLERLSQWLGKKQDGKKLSVALWKLEIDTHHAAEDYCNGIINSDQWEDVESQVKFAVYNLFNNVLPGFFVNGDPRGYALKIDDIILTNIYPDTIGITRDMGGYGILSPEI